MSKKAKRPARQEHAMAVMQALREGYEALGMCWGIEHAVRPFHDLALCSNKQVADMAGFIKYAWARAPGFPEFGKGAGRDNRLRAHVVSNIGHDLGGIAAGEKFFLPRTHGYSKHLKKEKKI